MGDREKRAAIKSLVSNKWKGLSWGSERAEMSKFD